MKCWYYSYRLLFSLNREWKFKDGKDLYSLFRRRRRDDSSVNCGREKGTLLIIFTIIYYINFYLPYHREEMNNAVAVIVYILQEIL